MNSFKQFNERALHKFFQQMDIKNAKNIHKELIKNQVIDKDHKFGDIIETADIDKFHSNRSSSHNFRDDIESYNSIVKRDKKYL